MRESNGQPFPIIADIDDDETVATVLAKQLCLWGHDSSVSIETTLWIGSPTEARNFSFPQNVQTEYGAHPASYLVFTGSSVSGGEEVMA
jgi:hypothetical protein